MTMKVGGSHKWRYRSNWHEKKVAPGTWKFHTSQTKVRKGRQFSERQGVRTGTTFTWRIRGKQVMHKVGPNKYIGHMKGTKKFVKRRS
jgi:hypothetical protein